MKYFYGLFALAIIGASFFSENRADQGQLVTLAAILLVGAEILRAIEKVKDERNQSR